MKLIFDGKVNKCIPYLKEGLYVETNGNLEMKGEDSIKGIIGEIDENSFYVWQNEIEFAGMRGSEHPSEKGYKYSWMVYKDNNKAWIKIYDEVCVPFKVASESIKNMLETLSGTLKRVLKPELQSQYKADLRNGELALTDKGKAELLEILAAKYEKELTDRAEEIIKDEEKK